MGRRIARTASFAALVASLWARSAFAVGDPAAGAAKYKTLKCQICHQVGGKGGNMGGSLDGVGSRRDAEWLRKIIQDPKSLDPKFRMKAYPDLPEKDLDDLVAYLLSLKAGPPKK